MKEQEEVLSDRLCIAMGDLVQARRFGLVLLEQNEAESIDSGQARGNDIRVALENALVVSYPRPFTQMRDKPVTVKNPLPVY